MASFQKYKTKNGDRWLFKMYTGIDPATGERKMTTRRGFKTKKEAQEAAIELQKEIESGLFQKDLTFEEVYKEWWETHSKTIKPSTRYKKITMFNKHILPRFGKLKIKDITKGYCQRQINDLASKLSIAQEIKIQANLIFKYALRMDYIAKNPMEFVVIPKSEDELLATEERRNFWTKDEVLQFLSLAEKDLPFQDYVMFYVLLFTGMRKGELMALEWSDIDFEEKIIRITKTLFFHKGREIVQTAKTYKSKREIFVDDDTLELLRKLKTKHKEALLALGIREEPKYVLMREGMRPLRLAHPNEVLSRFIKKHNLHPITVHGLRHTHASMLFEAGATIKDVQARLGHTRIETTMDVYTHVTKERGAEITQQLRKYFNSK